MEWTDREKIIIRFLQGDLPVTQRPFAALEAQADISEDEVVATLKRWQKDRTIRKLSGLIRHRKAGYVRNAMVAWAVPAERIDEVGICLAAFPEVTHCYQREPAFTGKYNLFTMIHQKDIPLEALLEKMAATIKIQDYLVLESLAELKKTSMEYF
ncbi:MAG: Lrp/AsnC family transcriptional regulator [Syntrophaceae bacterium]|nr:Lrp/AsnC family transcriptional regulator [Syntrophaceae bacterium]